MTLQLVVEGGVRAPDAGDLLRQSVEAALLDQGQTLSSELSLMLAGDAKLQDLNMRFLGENHITDVLSFPSGELGVEDSPYLGDIAISVPRAQAQAQVAGHPLEQELQLLTVHGVLHLLGHDHAEPVEKERMWAAQDRILASLGVSIHVAE